MAELAYYENTSDSTFKLKNDNKNYVNITYDGELILEDIKDKIYTLFKENDTRESVFRAFFLLFFEHSLILFSVWLGDYTSFNESLEDLPGLISIPIIMIVIAFIILLSSNGSNLSGNNAFVTYLISISYICIQLTNYIDKKYIMVIIGLIMTNSLGAVIYAMIISNFRYCGYLTSIFIISLISMLIFGYTVLKDSTKWIWITIGIDVFEVIFTSIVILLFDDFCKGLENTGILGTSLFNYGRIVALAIIGFICLILYGVFTGKIFENYNGNY